MACKLRRALTEATRSSALVWVVYSSLEAFGKIPVRLNLVLIADDLWSDESTARAVLTLVPVQLPVAALQGRRLVLITIHDHGRIAVELLIVRDFIDLHVLGRKWVPIHVGRDRRRVAQRL